MSRYTIDIHQDQAHCIEGPQWGSDTAFGFYSRVAFDTKEEAEKALEIANAAYRAGRADLQQEIKNSLSI